MQEFEAKEIRKIRAKNSTNKHPKIPYSPIDIL